MPLEDDAPVSDDVSLLRRVHPTHLVWDDNLGCRRLSTGLFRHPEMSVHLGDKLAELGIEPAALLADYPDHALVAFLAGAARQCEQEVVRQSTADVPAHGLVVGKKTEGRKRSLARASEWIVRPDDACDPPYA